jgi:acyl-CoA reductase-like NAD-dependent aldehyde dehydrogenase
METDISTITTGEQHMKIEDVVEEGLPDGRTILFQKDLESHVPKDGWYFPSTMLGDVSTNMMMAKGKFLAKFFQ